VLQRNDAVIARPLFVGNGITMSALFSPLRIRDLTLENRIVVSPMSQYSAENGTARDWHLVHYGALSNSGAGLVMVEATHIDRQGMGTNACLALYNDEQEAALKRVVDLAKRIGNSKIGLQLNHSGRKASMSLPWAATRGPLSSADGGWETLSASAIPFGKGWPAPAAATEADLKRVVEAYVSAAKRAQRIGFDVLEIHAAHGYLLHAFLTPLGNSRTDQYGGSLENRMRFPLEVFTAVRAVWSGPLGVKVSSTDWAESGGATIEDALAFCKELEAHGCDYVCMSSGAATADIKVPVAPNYQVQFAEAAKKAVSIPVWAVGLIYEAADAENIIASGRADAVAVARAFLDNPHWAYRAANEPSPTTSAAPRRGPAPRTSSALRQGCDESGCARLGRLPAVGRRLDPCWALQAHSHRKDGGCDPSAFDSVPGLVVLAVRCR
jgi:2,4-dienoyl-CoA reductase-like NADH-dependent reductase (Old Yellow Enzyme family)